MEPNYARDDNARRPRGRAALGALRPRFSVGPDNDREHRRPCGRLSFIRTLHPPKPEPRGWLDRAGRWLDRHPAAWAVALGLTCLLGYGSWLLMPWLLSMIRGAA